MKIRGAFLGGPTRTGTGRGAGGGPHLATAEEMERARVARLERRSGARRRTRVFVGVVAASAAALATGGLLGWATHASREELLAEPTMAGALDRMISKEVNRTLLELWKMEALEDPARYGRPR